MSKNIVVLSDGTGQEGGKGHDTNVYKLFRMLEDRTDRQIVFYDEGLGTDWHKFTGNAFGAGFSKNLLQCYQFIYENYNAGDRIYLFGFSRGAATVRSLASFIHYFGILPRSRPKLIKEAFKLYRKGQDKISSELFKQTYNLFRGGQAEEVKDELNEKATEFVHEHPNQWAKIEFMGVWDTVPALGVVALAGLNLFFGKILRYSFHDFKLHPSVKNAYHALSIDDDRLWFHPSLWTKKTREEQIVEQVWFSGAHTDVGGGFDEPGLSDITLEWMLEKAVNFGLRTYFGSRGYWNFVVAPDPTDLYHPPRTGFGKIFKKGSRNKVWTDQGADAAFGQPIIHKSVLERHKRHVHGNKSEPEDDRNPWILKETTKSSILLEESEFKKFLSQKFYDHLKYEWKKYDWKEDKQQDKDFKDWMIENHKEYYENHEWDFHKRYKEDGYKNHSIQCWKDKREPSTRSEWMENNPYEINAKLDPEWSLENYQPYKSWYKEHTVRYKKQTYYVEPFQKVAFEKLEDFKCYSPLQSGDEEKLEELGKAYLNIRDYDEEKLEELYQSYKAWGNGWLKEQTMEHEKHTYYAELFKMLKEPENFAEEKIIKGNGFGKDNLLKRGYNEKKKWFKTERFDRIGYDLGRWTKSNETYNSLFATQKNNVMQEE